MRNEDDLIYIEAHGFGCCHGYEMDAPDRIPAGATAKTWHSDLPYQQAVTR